jgi:multidrug efflux system outer membrane protein
MRKALLLLLLILVTKPALAQPAAPPRAGTPPGAPPQTAPSAGARPAATAAAGAGLELPPPPPVSDPMLTPVPPPKRLLASWREALADLRARSTDLRQSVDQVLQAEAQTRIALAQYLPSITGTGTYTHQLLTNSVSFPGAIPGLQQTSSVPAPNLFTGNVQLQQTIVNVQQYYQISINELGEDQARMSVDSEKRVLALSVANDIVAVVTAERSADINRVGLKVALEQVDIATRKRALGAATGLDVVRAQQNAANARATLVTGDETLREAREALGLALGTPEEVGVGHDLTIDGFAEDAMRSCRTVNSIDERPDVQAARANLEVAKKNLHNVWYQFLPTLNAQSTISANSIPANGYPNPTWNIQGILSIPLWDGGVRYGNLHSARAAEDIALQQLESLRRQAVIQVQQAQRGLVVAEDSYRVAKEQRDLAAQNDQMTQAGYMVGQGTSLELVTASEAHRQAELNLALEEYGLVKARILAALQLATCPW